MTRQQQRQAVRLLFKGRFPFPEMTDWFRNYVKDKPNTFAQIQEDSTIITNLSGEVQHLDVIEFRDLLNTLQKADTEPI